MKKIFVISVLLLALVVSCDTDDYEAPYGDFSSFLWTTSNGFEESDYVSALNDYIGFIDVSKNAIEHSWSIPSGTRLLNNEFTENDSIYTDFITASGPLSSQENLLNVLFIEPGVKEIILRNVFRDSVTESVEVDGNWIVEKTFTVNVFDDVKPAFQVLKGDEVVLTVSETDFPDAADAASWPTVTLEAGERLTYVDMTTVGEPDARTWTFDGGHIDSSGGASTNVFYNGLGNFLAGSITSKRNSIDKPDGEATKVIPLKIQVTPSTQPFVINGSIKENISEVISFKVTGEVGSLIGEEGNFTVNVVNTATGFDQNIAVQSIALNGIDATQIDLTLSAPIFNSDVVTVTYVSGNILSVDTRVLESFGPISVTMFFEGSMNIPGFTGYEIEWGGAGNQFKKANTEGYFAQHNANNEGGPLYYWRDTAMAYEGNSSMKFETTADGIPAIARLQGGGFSSLSPVSAGTYIPSVWVFIESGNTMNDIEYNFQNDTNFVFDISTTTRGEWVRLTLEEVVLGDINSGRFDINIKNTGQDDAIVQKLWLDNFDLLISEPRQ